MSTEGISSGGGESQVTHEMGCLDKAVEALKTTVESLFQRLDNVLTSEPPEGDAATETEKDTLVPLAKEIQSTAHSIRWCVGRLEHLKGRLEL